MIRQYKALLRAINGYGGDQYHGTSKTLTLYKVVGNNFPPPVFEIRTKKFLLCFSSFHLMTKTGENFRKKDPLNVLVVS